MISAELCLKLMELNCFSVADSQRRPMSSLISSIMCPRILYIIFQHTLFVLSWYYKFKVFVIDESTVGRFRSTCIPVIKGHGISQCAPDNVKPNNIPIYPNAYNHKYRDKISRTNVYNVGRFQCYTGPDYSIRNNRL